MTKARILVIEDDPDTARVLRAYLEYAGFEVDIAVDGPTGLDLALKEWADLIVLDWMLPGLNGIEVLQRLRPEVQTPVILLTARGETEDRLQGFEHGVDDYVPKPFHPPELIARVHAVLRRSQPEQRDKPVEVGDLVIDPDKRRVFLAGEEVNLTTLEFDLLHLLATNPGRVFRRNELLDRAWGRDFAGVDRVVDVHVSNLRQKLEKDGGSSFIQTVRGIGYAFWEDFL
jgi:DNA-binding response OmpR family regulator